MIEPTLNLTTLGKNETYTDLTAMLRQVYHLLTMKPGTDPLNPEKGCDLNKYYYWFKDEVNTLQAEQEIKDQIEKYTKYANLVKVKLFVKRKGPKWILYVYLTTLDSAVSALISTNGTTPTYTDANDLGAEILDAINAKFFS